MATKSAERHKSPAEKGVASWLHFLQAYRAMIDDLEAVFGRAPVSLVEYELLWRLAGSLDGHLLIQELNDLMILTPSGVSRLLTRMETAGLLRRQTLQRDRRLVSVVITDEGRRVHSEYNDLYHRALQISYTQHLSAEEREQLDALFQKFLLSSGRRPE